MFGSLPGLKVNNDKETKVISKKDIFEGEIKGFCKIGPGPNSV